VGCHLTSMCTWIVSPLLGAAEVNRIRASLAKQQADDRGEGKGK
jgi:hypothetical protein